MLTDIIKIYQYNLSQYYSVVKIKQEEKKVQPVQPAVKVDIKKGNNNEVCTYTNRR